MNLIVARASSPWFRYAETIDCTRSMVKSVASFRSTEISRCARGISVEYDRSSRRTKTTGWKPVLRPERCVSERRGRPFMFDHGWAFPKSFQNVRMRIGMCGRVSEIQTGFWDVQRRFGISESVLEFPKAPWKFRNRFGNSEVVLEFPKAFWNFQIEPDVSIRRQRLFLSDPPQPRRVGWGFASGNGGAG